ncbi:MAG TPA: histidine kinase [Spirochaetales bacterium]|nr:histidine kinase [Spirochaetales bacterium]
MTAPLWNKGLRNRIIANSVVILLVLVVATSYTAVASLDVTRSIELLFRNSVSMEQIRTTLRETQENLTGYLSAKNSESLKDFIRNSTLLSDMGGKLNKENKTDEALLLEKDLTCLIDSYLTSAEGAVQAKRGRNVAQYVSLYEDARHTASLINFLSGKMDSIYLGQSLNGFSAFKTNIGLAIISNGVLLLVAFLLSLVLIARYSYTITEPLTKLSLAADAVARGEYDHPLPPYERDDEIRTLHDAFDHMQSSIQEAFAELKRKAELERSLMEERMRVLTYQHRLKDAELLALQTQINPHFLYNTLAAGWQLALAEGNERTAEFLEKLAAFIRYTLKPSTRFVLVSEEIECVRQYIWLLKMRFGERYRFRIEVQDEVTGYETPALILQPLVENAVVHGFKDYEEGGEIVVSARLEGDSIRLSVSDSGKGMEKEEIAIALAAADLEDTTPQHGIGLHNVVRRVALATAEQGKVEIQSELGHGTRVTIILPIGIKGLNQ